MKLNEQPLCADPFGVHAAQGEVVVATDVHHVDVVSDGNPVLTELSRLQSLCHSCHSRVTAATTQGRGAGDGGWGQGAVNSCALHTLDRRPSNIFSAAKRKGRGLG